jgi:hypothetical protein
MASDTSTMAAPPRYIYQPEDWPWVWVIRTPAILTWPNGVDKDEIRRMAPRQHDRMAAPRCVVPLEDYQKKGITYKVIHAKDEEDYRC